MENAFPIESSPVVETTETLIPIVSEVKRKPRVWTVFVKWIVGALVGQIAVIAACIAIELGIGVLVSESRWVPIS